MSDSPKKIIVELEDQLSSGTYYKRNIMLVRGQGAHLWDESGMKFIDCVGGQGSANLGHRNPYVNQAIQDQADKLIVCNELFYHEERANLLKRLFQLTPVGIERFFLCNSGSAAIEGAIKFARLATGRQQIIATMRGFHGKSLGALSATWNKTFRQPFEPLVPGFTHIPFNNSTKLREIITDQTAAFLVEVIQGEGGVRLASAEFLKVAKQRCEETGALLIVDEVQTGFGRTGKMFALEHFDLSPDILCLAKSMGGGLPIGAIGINQAVASQIFKLAHTSTFGGNPLACAAANAAIRYLEEFQLCERAKELGSNFIQKLKSFQLAKVREVRGLGLMVGVELKEKSGPYIQKLLQKGVLALAAGPTLIRYLPPLVIEQEDLDKVADITAEVLQ